MAFDPDKYRKFEGAGQEQYEEPVQGKWLFRFFFAGMAMLSLIVAFGHPEHLSHVYLYIAGH